MGAETRDIEWVLKQCKDREVSFIRLWFTDVLGVMRSFAISPGELDGALREGMGFDGSSIEGFARIEESDMIAFPDPNTFKVLPWRAKNGVVASLACDIRRPDGEPYEGDPRYALRRMLTKAAEKGYTFYVGPELEYFYFEDDTSDLRMLDRSGYFGLAPANLAVDLRRETVQSLQCMGIDVEYSHHEVAPSQHEIDLKYTDALAMADYTMMYRHVVKAVAAENGVYATFMPKPLFGENGSGMHVHQSLFKGKKNAFFDPKDEYFLSAEAKGYIAGLLTHAREYCAVIAQWVNSYKRLVPGYEAPCYICWGRRNRSAMVRVPEYKPGKEHATRTELRSPDPACNPYLAFAVMLAAGLKGIEDGYKLPEPVERDVYALTHEDLDALGIESLPRDLGHATDVCESSELVREALGEHIFEKFIENKKIEWDNYRTRVSEYELDKYLPLL
ncbi:MAG: glutamine synthetase family protein [Planctomycetota bacterium]